MKWNHHPFWGFSIPLYLVQHPNQGEILSSPKFWSGRIWVEDFRDVIANEFVPGSQCPIVPLWKMAFHCHFPKRLLTIFQRFGDLWCELTEAEMHHSHREDRIFWMAGHPSFAEFLTKNSSARRPLKSSRVEIKHTPHSQRMRLVGTKTGSLQNISCRFAGRLPVLSKGKERYFEGFFGR